MAGSEPLLAKRGDPGAAALAAGQAAVISTQQLYAVGLGPGAIKVRVREGRLHRVHRGVYDLAERATSRYEEAREKTRALINAPSLEEVILTPNVTGALNHDASHPS